MSHFLNVCILLLLFDKTIFAVEQCEALFVIDGSSYYLTFRAEITAITTAASVAFSNTQSIFFANYWEYGGGDDDEKLPNDFLKKNDFLDGVQGLQSYGGSESIVGATSKLNQWQIDTAVIVLYTASPQSLITIAGTNYTEQGRTIVVHSNDGVDMSPLSNYPSPGISEYTALVELIIGVCKNMPTKPTMQPSPTTQIPVLQCRAQFYIDASVLGKPTAPQQTALISSAATLLFNGLSAGEFYSNCSNIFVNCSLSFHAAIASYGDATSVPPNPSQLMDSFTAFSTALNALTFNSPDNQNIVDAINIINGNAEFANVITVLFTNSPQALIDNITGNAYQDRTLGFGISGQNMYHIADSTMNLGKPPTELSALIKTYCGWRF
ncbi:unnamed protein product, partial [Mesorhabditis belari]|uniref:VWFA domain-containing protein n=1 Tax=Mesorhabditis belari TaxID=2138241 RepID=A0AAF3EGW5_9BILA